MDVEFLHALQPTSPSSSSSYAYVPPPAASPYNASATAAAAAMCSNSPTSGDWAARGRRGSGSAVSSEATGRLVSGFLTCVFAVVLFFVGAVTGALRGLATEIGLLRGAGIGAVSGALFSIVVESSLLIWRSNGSGIWSLLYVIDIIASLPSGRLVWEKLGPAIHNAVRSQMSAVDAPFREALDIFETGGTGGMAMASVDRIPKLRVTTENSVDACGERFCCSVCLQDLQPGETARRLPHCRHMFHLHCIDCWLVRHGSCPLCRWAF